MFADYFLEILLAVEVATDDIGFPIDRSLLCDGRGEDIVVLQPVKFVFELVGFLFEFVLCDLREFIYDLL